MKHIDRNSKILSITHNDLDGVGCAILLGAVFENITYTSASYQDIDRVMIGVDKDDYDYIFITDISPNIPESLDRLDNFILIDHHQTALGLHNPKRNYFVNTKYSGTMLVKMFLDKMYGVELLEQYTKFVTLINDYDLWIHKYPQSKHLNTLYSYYKEEPFRKRFSTGNLSLTKNEKKRISDWEKKFETRYDELELMEFEKINACMFKSRILVNELSHKLLYDDGYDFVFFNTGQTYKVSVRSKHKEFNIGVFLKELGIGGGHPMAAGIEASSESESVERLLLFEKEVYKKLPSVRKKR